MTHRRVRRILNRLLGLSFGVGLLIFSFYSFFYIFYPIKGWFNSKLHSSQQLTKQQVPLETIPKGKIKLSIVNENGQEITSVVDAGVTASVLGVQNLKLDKDKFIDATNTAYRSRNVEISIDEGKDESIAVSIGPDIRYKRVGVCKNGDRINTFALVRFTSTIQIPHVVMRGNLDGRGKCINLRPGSTAMFYDEDGNPVNNVCFSAKTPASDNTSDYNHYNLESDSKDLIDGKIKEVAGAPISNLGLGSGTVISRVTSTNILIPGNTVEHLYPGAKDQESKLPVYMLMFNSADANLANNTCWKKLLDNDQFSSINPDTGNREIGKPGGLLLYQPITEAYPKEVRKPGHAFMDVEAQNRARLPGSQFKDAENYGNFAMYNKKEGDFSAENLLNVDGMNTPEYIRQLLIKGFFWQYPYTKNNRATKKSPISSELWYMSDSAESASAPENSKKDWNRVPMSCVCKSLGIKDLPATGYWSCKVDFGVPVLTDIESQTVGVAGSIARSRGDSMFAKYNFSVPGDVVEKASIVELSYALGLLKAEDKSYINNPKYRNLTDNELNNLVCAFWPLDGRNHLPNVSAYPVVANFFYQVVKVDVAYTLPLIKLGSVKCDSNGNNCSAGNRFTVCSSVKKKSNYVPIVMSGFYDELDNSKYIMQDVPGGAFDAITTRIWNEAEWGEHMVKNPILVDIEPEGESIHVYLQMVGPVDLIEYYDVNSKTVVFKHKALARNDRQVEEWLTRLANHPRCRLETHNQ